VIGAVSSIALSGLQTAATRFERSAERTTAWSPASSVDLAKETVEQIEAKHAFSASLSVIRTADEMLGALLDVRA
jgi:flagellar hook protein FlgE